MEADLDFFRPEAGCFYSIQQEKMARRALEDRIGDDLYKLDVREMIYLIGMQNLDDTESILHEWGANI